MFVIVGLGNPGPKYALTRHNVGFMIIDALAMKLGTRMEMKRDFNAEVAKVSFEGKDVLLLKPMTFMNNSGQSVQAIMSFYKISPENLLVLHDEVDLPFGQLRLQKNRGHGGHNGIRDIHAKIGPDYSRLRVGVGRPTIPQFEVADYVLQNFSKEELGALENTKLDDFAEAPLTFIEDGFLKAQNKINS